MSERSKRLAAGAAKHQQGLLDQAEAIYREVLATDPQAADALHLLGVIHTQRGNHETAIQLIQRAIEQNGRAWSYHSNLACALVEAGQPARAIESYRRAVALQPSSAPLYSNLANAHLALGQLEEAEHCYHQAIRLDANYAEAHYNLGNLRRKREQFDEAIACYERAIAIKPDYSEAHANLGNLLQDRGQIEEAIRSYRWALEIGPRNVEAQYNLGRALKASGKLDAALDAYERSIALRPNYAEAHNARGLLLLRLGRFEEGWPEYEWRWKKTDSTPLRELPYPEWRGEPLTGKTIFSYSEQGIGDEIMFGSCLPDVIQQAQHCIIDCDPRLEPLFARSFPTATVRPRQGWAEHDWLADCPTPDYQVPVGNLPRYLRPTTDSFPDRPHFLIADPQQTAAWQERLARLGPQPKVGICWRGAREDESKKHRSTNLIDWAPLLSIADVRFVNLQYGASNDEIARVSSEFGIDVGSWSDFDPDVEIDSLAALISALDLVITVGNTTAHLAGALGKPTWTLLSAEPSWRWMLDRADSPWYPSLELIRQPQLGDWSSVFETARRRLCDRFHLSKPNRLEQTEKTAAHDSHTTHVDLAPSRFTTASQAAGSASAAQIRLTDNRLGLHDNSLEEAYQLGVAAHRSQDLARAEGIYRELLRHRPKNFSTLHMMACLTRETGRPQLAVEFARRAIDVRPDNATIHVNLATALIDQELYDEAKQHLEFALELDPNSADAHINLGALYERIGDFDPAYQYCRRGVELAPDRPCAHYNLANVLFHLGRVDECIASHQRVLELNPNYAKSRWNQGLAYLLDARFAEGWPGYEYRQEAKQVDIDEYPQPRWEGSPLAGKRLLIHAEQGVGDEIMFASCYRDVLELGADCILLCEPRLAPLFQRSFPEAKVHGVRRIIGRPWTPPETFDFEIPAGSLPRLFRPNWESFPRRPYLQPDAELTQIWRERLEQLGEGLKIGISWRAGGRASEQRRRSTQLEDWRPLLEVPGLCWVNLQYGDCEQDVDAARHRWGVTIHDWPDADPTADLDGFAAQVAALDFVISVGNTTVHMAGAVGVPAWSVLPRVPGWRWMVNQSEMPWYADVWLDRQRTTGDWPELFQRVASRLREQLADGSLEMLAAARREERFSRFRKPATTNQGKELTPAPSVQHDHVERHETVSTSDETQTRDHTEALTEAIRLHRAGDLSAAAEIYQRVLDADPNDPDALHLLGTLYHQRGDHQAAIEHIQSSLEKLPRAVAYYNLANALRDAARCDEAISAYQRAVELDPHLAEAHLNLGALLRETGRLDDGKLSLRRALLARPDMADAHTQIGLIHIAEQAPVKALKSFERAAELQPHHARAHMHVAGVLRQLGRSSEALERFDRALELDPSDAEVHVQRGMLLLQLGRLEEGWPEWQWRWKSQQSPTHRTFAQPQWDGSPLVDKRILVHGEQGIGDEIMFASCLPDVVDQAQHCIVECEPRLAGLFRRSFPTATVQPRISWDDVSWVEPLKPIDFQIPSGSLPAVLRRSLDDFPQRRSYLLADRDRRLKWRDRLAALPASLKIGISWHARTSSEEPARTAPLANWRPLWQLPQTSFISLQYGDCQAALDEQRQQCQAPIVTWDDFDPARDFDDLAAVIAELDLVITVGNTTAHLAGALGVEVWTLVSSAPSWRWLVDRQESPWYPSMKVFQQASVHAWQEIFQHLHEALKRRVQAVSQNSASSVPAPHASAWRNRNVRS